MSELPFSNDPYEVLGVAREVSEKDLKRRYFALLRQFPPETHPEEFNRVQQAYAVLSDPEARAALESTGPFQEVEEPYRSRLREILQNLDSERADFARVELKTLVEERPDLSEARNLLQQVLFRQGQHAEAEAEAQELVRQSPQNPFFRYRWALSLRTLDRVPEAIEQVEVWRDLTEKKAVEPWQFLAELLAVQGRVSEAIECLTEGMSYVPEPLALLMSRIRMYANGLYSSRLAPDLAELARGIPESDTPARTAAAARLFSIAATYFDRAKPDQANQILREAHALREKSEVLQFPVSLSFELSELPSSTQEWLEQESKEVHIFRVAKATGTEISALDWIALIVLATLVGIGVSAEAWTWGGAVSYFAFLATFGALIVEAIARRLRQRKKALPPMTSLHPWYLLSTEEDKLSVFPLVNLTDVSPAMSNQLVSVRLNFGTRVVVVNISDRDLAQRFAETITNLRSRTLDLLDTGMIEADQGYEFIPAPMLDPQWKSPLAAGRRTARRQRVAVTVAISALLTIFWASEGTRALKVRSWAKLVNNASIAAAEAAEDAKDVAPEDQALVSKVRAQRLAQTLEDLSARARDEEQRRRILSWATHLEKGPVDLGWSMTSLDTSAAEAKDPVWAAIGEELARHTIWDLVLTRAAPQLRDSLLLSTRATARVMVKGQLKPGPAQLRLEGQRSPLPELELTLDSGDGAPLTLLVGLDSADLPPLRSTPDPLALGRTLAQALRSKAARRIAIELGLTPLDRR